MQADQPDETTQVYWATVGPNAATIAGNPHETIVPQTADPDSAGRRALAMLASSGRGEAASVVLEGTLGEGGMGIVRLGTQQSLGRKVAVKTLRTEHCDEAAVLKLLREAWVTGALEHPNIMPIHDVRLDDERMPLVVLKRIEGIDWCELIADGEVVRERFGAEDLLEHNLQILMQVCQAVAFAHSRGIVHRDLKPENVRIGEFGEVYVLDWGIAVALEDDGSGRFPCVSDAREMAGTPSFMAPEMLGGDMPAISERSDVYLLGAILYTILAGEPPHLGESAVTIVRSVIRSDPQLPDDAPEELCAIVRRCMLPDPVARFESADAVRNAIQQFLKHRDSAVLAAHAWHRLEHLEQLLASPEVGTNLGVAAYDLFGECRFGFGEALQRWPQNEAAHRGRQRAAQTMIGFELGRGDGRAAAALLEQLEDPPAELRERVDVGLREQARKEQHLEELEELDKDLDPAVGKRTRMFVLAAFAAVWTLMPLLGELGTRYGHHPSRASVLAICVAALLIAVALGVWARESMTKTAINRRIGGTIAFMLGAQVLLVLGGMLLGIALSILHVLFIFLWFMTIGALAISVERKLAGLAAMLLVAFFFACWRVELRYYAMSAANLVTTVYTIVIWRPRQLFGRT